MRLRTQAATALLLLLSLLLCAGPEVRLDGGIHLDGDRLQERESRVGGGGPCVLQPNTQYESPDVLGHPQPLQPDECCAACLKNPQCQSWTVFDSQQSTQCSLFRTAGAEQKPSSKTGDARYTSGFLPKHLVI